MFDKLIEKLSEQKPQVIDVSALASGAQILALPNTMGIRGIKTYLDEYLKKPERRSGTLTAFDSDSFVKITNRFKNSNSALFQKASYGDNAFSASLLSILNYSPATDKNEDADNNDHRVQYGFPISEELKLWLGNNKKPMNSVEFATFLEDNIADMVVATDNWSVNFGENGVPAFATPSKIVELSRGIEVRVDERVTNAYRVSDGSFAMQYTNENKDATGQPLKLPEWFCLGIKVFENGDFYQLPARLRFRVKEGQVAWHYELYRKRDVLSAAFTTDCTNAASLTGLPLYNGMPE